MRRRIAICLGLLLGAVVLGDTAAIIALNQSITVLSRLVESHRIQTMREHLAAAGQRVRADQMATLAGLPPEASDQIESQSELRTSVTQCNTCHHEDPVRAELDDLAALTETYLSRLRLPAALAKNVQSKDDRSAVLQLGQELVDRITVTADRAGRHLTLRADQATRRVRRARSMLFLSAGVILVLGLVGVLHLQRRLTRPITNIMEGINRLQGGDHTYRFSLTGDPEFRDMARAFNDAYVELQRAQKAVVHAERLAAVGQLGAGVAHEILNPMASISSVAQILRRHSDEPAFVDKVNLIMKEIDRVTTIVRDLNAFSRSDDGETPTDVDLNAALDHAINLVLYDKRASNATITQNRTADEVVIRGYFDRVVIVLMNILFNALDAISELSDGSGRISVSTSVDGQIVLVCIHDNGPGMTDEQIGRAFEPFFTTKPPGAGTGLGLWNSNRIVEAIGGSIAIESGPTSGTTLKVRLLK